MENITECQSICSSRLQPETFVEFIAHRIFQSFIDFEGSGIQRQWWWMAIAGSRFMVNLITKQAKMFLEEEIAKRIRKFACFPLHRHWKNRISSINYYYADISILFIKDLRRVRPYTSLQWQCLQ